MKLSTRLMTLMAATALSTTLTADEAPKKKAPKIEKKAPQCDITNKAIEKAVAELNHKQSKVRLAAARSLEKFGLPAIPLLKKALKHKDPEVSVSAKLILAKIASKAKKPLPPRLPDGCPGCGLG